MQQRLLALRRAEQAGGAAADRLALESLDAGAADRTFVRHREFTSIRRAALRDDTDHLGNDVAGTAHDNVIAYTHVFAPDLIFVMQRGVGNRDAANEHRRKPCNRSQRTSAPDLHGDIQNLRDFLLRRILVRHGEARCARYETEAGLAAQIVYLVYHAVDLERQREAPFADCLVVAQQTLHALDDLARVCHRKMHRLQIVELVTVHVIGYFAVHGTQSVREKSQMP